MRVLGEKAVAGMDAVDVGDLGRAHDGGNVQVALLGLGAADADRFIRELDVQALPVGLGVDRHGADVHLLAGADDPDGNLAAVGHQDFLEHAVWETCWVVVGSAGAAGRRRLLKRVAV